MHMDKTSSVESKNMGDYRESGGRVGLLSMSTPAIFPSAVAWNQNQNATL